MNPVSVVKGVECVCYSGLALRSTTQAGTMRIGNEWSAVTTFTKENGLQLFKRIRATLVTTGDSFTHKKLLTKVVLGVFTFKQFSDDNHVGYFKGLGKRWWCMCGVEDKWQRDYWAQFVPFKEKQNKIQLFSILVLCYMCWSMSMYSSFLCEMYHIVAKK